MSARRGRMTPLLNRARPLAVAPLAQYLVDRGVTGSAGVQLTRANSEYLSCPINSALQVVGTAITLAGWFRLSAYTVGQTLTLASLANAPSPYAYRISYLNQNVNLALYNNATNTANATVSVPQAGSFPLGTWIFIAASYNAGARSISANDGMPVTGSFVNTFSTVTADFQLGARDGAECMDGQMRAWGKWDRVLTGAEITWLYNSGASRDYADLAGGNPGLLTGLRAWWDLGEATGATRLDSVGTAHLTPQKSSGVGPLKVVAVSGWADQMPGHYDITFPSVMTNRLMWVDAQQNSLPVMRSFRISSSAGTYGTGPAMGLSSLSNLTLLTVAKRGADANGFIPWSNDDGTNGLYLIQANSGTFNGDQFRDRTLTAGANPTPVYADSSYRLLGGQFNGTAQKMFMRSDGSGQSSATHSNSTPLGMANFELGRRGSSLHTSGDLGDLYLYDRYLAPTQLSAVETALLSRWGLTRKSYAEVIVPTQGDDNTLPGAVKCPNGSILVFANQLAGSSNTIYSCRSSDSGVTWSDPVVVDQPASSTHTYASLGPFRRSSGQVLLPVRVVPTVGAERLVVYGSTDNGSTWSVVCANAGLFGYPVVPCYGAITEPTVSGSPMLWMPAYGFTVNLSDSILLQSVNGGVTWTLRSVIAAHTATFSYSETDVIGTGGDNYLAIVREDKESGAGEIGKLYKCTSTDAGLTWSAPTLLFDGVSPALMASPAGNGILLFTAHRNTAVAAPTTTRGVVVRRSLDSGATWGTPYQLYAESANVGFVGYPAPVALADGTIGLAHRDDSAMLKWTTLADNLIP